MTDLGGGTYTFAGSETALRAILPTLSVTPPAHSDVDFNLTVTLRASETNPTTVGEVATLNAETASRCRSPSRRWRTSPCSMPPPRGGNEDTPIGFGANIAYSLVDTDGSEAVTAVVLENFPAGVCGYLRPVRLGHGQHCLRLSIRLQVLLPISGPRLTALPSGPRSTPMPTSA